MRKIFISFIAVLLTTICAVAQLPYNTVMTQSHFNDGNTKIASSGDNAWDGGVRLGGKSTSIFNPSGPAYNWDDKYIIIALSSNGIPHHLTCNTSTNSNSTSDTKFYVATSSDNKTYTEKWSSDERDNTIDLELAKDVKYIKLCYSANFAGYFKNIKVSELIEVKDPAKKTLDAGAAEINTENTTVSTTMEWCNTPAFNLSITGEGASQFTASISNNASKGKYGTATISATYKHNVLGTHNATLTISNGAFTKEIALTGTTTKKTPYLLWRTDLEEKLPLNEVVTDPAYSPNGQNLPIIYSSSDEEVLKINGNSFITVAEGTATITASTEETDEYNAATPVTKTFTVTVKKIQSIVWSDNLTRLKIGDQPVTLTAIVQLVDSTGNKYDAPERTALLTYTSADNKVVSVSGNVLTIVGEGETTLAAEVPGDDEQAIEPASVTIPVKVRQPSVGCEDALLVNEPKEIEFFKVQTNRDEIISDSYKIGAGVPGYLTFQYRGKKYWTGNFKGSIKAQQSIDNGSNWSDVVGSTVTTVADQSKSLTVQLDRRATHVRFVHLKNGEGYHYVSNVVVTPAQYLETDIKSISENSILGATILKNININYSNVKDEDLAVSKSHPNVLISNEYFDVECGDFGTKTLQVGIIPTEIGTINDEIVIVDAVSGMKAIVPITINVKRDNQTIAWEQDLANIYTTDTLTLNAKAKTEVYYTSSDSTIAYAEDNVLKINKHGQFTLTAIAVESEKYEQATVSKEITINAVKPTVFIWPTVEPIAYAQALTTNMLMGGEAEVEGYFDWNTERNQTLVPGTHDLRVRFMPTNTNYYAPVDGTVAVTINKSAQSIVWNDSFENITVIDSIVLNASAQTKVTYEVSDTELAYITDNNVLYFHRGGTVQVTAYAEEDAYYLADTRTRELEILPAYPTILTYPTASPISYGQKLGESVLSDGEASVSGSFAWADEEALLEAGGYHQTVLFTPDDQVSYKNIEIPVVVLVNPIAQTITWDLTTIEVRQGQSLQLSATASSDLPVTYAVDNASLAKVENNIFYALEVGEVVVTATQDGTYTDEDGDLHANYTAAEPVSKTIVIVPQQSPQTIVWNDNLSNVLATADITLSATAQAPIHYLSSDSTIAYVEADKLIIKRFGTLTITAVAQQTEDYDQAILVKEVNIVAATPNIIAWPTVQPVTYGTKLNVTMLSGGEAYVDGYFDWNTDLSQELVPGTYTLGVRFVPANLNIYATVLDSVEVIVNKAPQTIVWNNNFENILVSDTIVLNAYAQTTITYEVSDIEVAALEGNILSFHRGGTINVTAYAEEDAYYLANTLTRELTILPGKPIIVSYPTAHAITYGQTLSESILEGGEASTAGSFEWMDSLALPNAGAGWQYVHFVPEDQESFSTVEFQIELVVNRAPQTITWELTNFVMKVGDVLNLTAVATSGLEVTYKLDDDTYAEINNNVLTALQVGTVTVTASQDGTYVDEFGEEFANYLEAKPVLQTITIVAKDINTGADMIFNEVQAAKVIRDGRLYIIRNGHIYNANGQVIE